MILFVMIRALTYFRIFDRMRYLIAMVLTITLDMIPFLIVSFIFIITFTLMTLVVRRMDTVDMNPKRKEPWFVFTMNSLIFFKKVIIDEESMWYDWAIYFMSTGLLTILLLTLLVSIVEDTYGNV